MKRAARAGSHARRRAPFRQHFPARRSARRVPAILERTPYGKGADHHAQLPGLRGPRLRRGGARTCAAATNPKASSIRSTQEPADGDDTLNWIARQPWSRRQDRHDRRLLPRASCSGKRRCSDNPHLKAIFPVVSGWDDYRDRFYSTGGAMKLGNRLEWMAENLKAAGYQPDFSKFVLHLPLRTRGRGRHRAAVGHVPGGAGPSGVRFASGAPSAPASRFDKVRIPVFAVGGWYDNFVESDLEAYAALHKSCRAEPDPDRAVAAQHVVPVSRAWISGRIPQVPVRALQLEWFDQWLMGKDAPLVSEPPVKIFVMGSNRWREEREWPPAEARAADVLPGERRDAPTRLDGDGALAEKPAGTQPRADRFVFDPRDPAPTRGGAVCCNPRVFPWGPMDQRPVEQPQGRAGLHHQAARRGSGSHRAGEGGSVRLDQRARHRLHGQAGGRLPGRLRAQPDRRHPAAALPRFAGEARAGQRRARSTGSPSMPA